LRTKPVFRQSQLRTYLFVLRVPLDTPVGGRRLSATCLERTPTTPRHVYIVPVGGVAQWLGRRSMAGGLSWYSHDRWFTCDQFLRSVRYGSANQANSAFHPFGVGKWV